MARETYIQCRCPKCKLALDDVDTYIEACPRCDATLEPEAVWQTRRYPGHVEIPPWVMAFTWPLLLLGLGVFVALYASMMLGAMAASIGLIFFLFKLTSNDRDV